EKHKEWTNTVLGRIVIDGPSLMVEVNSQRRAETIRARIEQHLGAGARYLNTEIESPQAMLARHDTDADAGEDTAQENELAALPEVRESLTQMLRAHYQRWIDEPIPLLGNRTPREAVGDPDGREAVAALVVQLERDGTKMNPPLDPAIVRELREALGLTRGG